MLTPKYIQTSEHYEALALAENHFDCINQESHTKYCFIISHFCQFTGKQAYKSNYAFSLRDLGSDAIVLKRYFNAYLTDL